MGKEETGIWGGPAQILQAGLVVASGVDHGDWRRSCFFLGTAGIILRQCLMCDSDPNWAAQARYCICRNQLFSELLSCMAVNRTKALESGAGSVVISHLYFCFFIY